MHQHISVVLQGFRDRKTRIKQAKPSQRRNVLRTRRWVHPRVQPKIFANTPYAPRLSIFILVYPRIKPNIKTIEYSNLVLFRHLRRPKSTVYNSTTCQQSTACTVGTNYLVRAVVALVADAHQRARPHVRVADHALPITCAVSRGGMGGGGCMRGANHARAFTCANKIKKKEHGHRLAGADQRLVTAVNTWSQRNDKIISSDGSYVPFNDVGVRETSINAAEGKLSGDTC